MDLQLYNSISSFQYNEFFYENLVKIIFLCYIKIWHHEGLSNFWLGQNRFDEKYFFFGILSFLSEILPTHTCWQWLHQWGSFTHQMAVPVPSMSCCVLNHHNLFYQIQNALAFHWDLCYHLEFFGYFSILAIEHHILDTNAGKQLS